MNTLSHRSFYILNGLITILVLSFLFWLLYFRQGLGEARLALSKLPAVNAALNGASAALLIAGFIAIKNRREFLHKNLMISACVVSLAFLVAYVYYHSMQGDTKFSGEGWIRPLYFFILISHILLSMIVFPVVLPTIYFGLRDNRRLHRKIARYTFPMWLYVSVTGVVIFFFLKTYS
jgi:putative membrane protein